LGDGELGLFGGAVLTRAGSQLRLRADVAGGIRVLTANVYPQGCATSQCSLNAGIIRPLVAPRLVVDEWLSPWFSAAAWADIDALNLPSFALGLSIAIHFWAFDGVP
jgi:hypothetical protein